MVETDPHPEAGALLAGKYRVERVLGKGGVGVVVQATHLELNKRVAIKFLRAQAMASPDAVERFAREARAAAMICSEHVARVYDVGKLDGGVPYMVMEFLEGRDLDQVLADGPLGVEQTVEYVLQACEALAEAHNAGIIHRDLKPANLFLAQTPDGSQVLKILDFGISKVTGRASRGSPLHAVTSQIMGSPGYMAPEQMRSTRGVDHRTDIWALGTVMYELLTARAAFVADSLPELFFQITEEEPDPIDTLRADVPPALTAAVMRCLRKKPADRFADVGELAEAIAPHGPVRTHSLAAKVKRVLERKVVSTNPPPPPVPPREVDGSADLDLSQSASSAKAEPPSAGKVALGRADTIHSGELPELSGAGHAPASVSGSPAITTDRELAVFREASLRRRKTIAAFTGVGIGLSVVVAYALLTHASARVPPAPSSSGSPPVVASADIPAPLPSTVVEAPPLPTSDMTSFATSPSVAPRAPTAVRAPAATPANPTRSAPTPEGARTAPPPPQPARGETSGFGDRK